VKIDEDVDEDLISMDGIDVDDDVSKIIIQLWHCYLFRIRNFLTFLHGYMRGNYGADYNP
jgi:hypothetical protein